MVTFGGTGFMAAGAVVSGLLLLGIAWLLRRRLGWVSALSLTGLVWSLLVIALVTLVPPEWGTGFVPAETRSATCSMDYGGPAPQGFWVFDGTQRALNTALFVPAGALLVLSAARWRAGCLLAPLGLLGLVGYSVLIEVGQLVAARINRACDITDVVDNLTGVGIGALLGVGLALLLRPWRATRS